MMDPDAATSSTRRFGDPRIAAGSPLANDILKCALKPVPAEDYKQPLSDEQLKAESSVPAGSVGL